MSMFEIYKNLNTFFKFAKTRFLNEYEVDENYYLNIINQLLNSGNAPLKHGICETVYYLDNIGGLIYTDHNKIWLRSENVPSAKDLPIKLLYISLPQLFSRPFKFRTLREYDELIDWLIAIKNDLFIEADKPFNEVHLLEERENEEHDLKFMIDYCERYNISYPKSLIKKYNSDFFFKNIENS